MAYAVGIDLGTTNTVVAVVRDGVAATLADPNGARLLPSVVAFHASGSVVVGRGAVERRLIDPTNTVYSVKRLIGRSWDSPEVRDARAHLPFELREGANGGTAVVARGETFSLPEISAFVLREAKALAEAALDEAVEKAVITVPANFNDLQRAATKMAGRLAGLEVLRILNEPTAAALAYGTEGKASERVAVYDFGGGTFDVTVLDLASSVFEVLATAGDSALGGDDLDVVVAERMADDLLKKHRFDARADPAAFGRLRILGEQMKRELSVREDQTLAIDDIVPGDRGTTVPWRFRMTRPELEWASLEIVERTFKVCQRALDAATVAPNELDRIILVGGATRMPLVARKVEQFFGRPPVVRINPDEVVALGAAIQAGLLDRSRPSRAGVAVRPRIDEASVMQPLPVDSSDAAHPEDLPLIRATSARIAQPPSPPPMPRPSPAAQSAADFLPGNPSKPLVFDAPGAKPAFEPKPGRTLVFDLPPAEPPIRSPASHASSFAAQAPRQAAPASPPAAASRPAAPPPPAAPPRQSPAASPPAGPPRQAGQASRAAVEPPPVRAPLLIDVTPLTLTVETVGGFCDQLIEANTPVPCDRTRNFATASDGQTTVRVRVAQGESKRFTDNTFLGELELSGIPAAGRGQAQVAVTFEIDVDGILNVRARETNTGRETKARIQLVGAQSEPADLEAMRARQAAHPLLDRRAGSSSRG
ncbi:MAG TPA: Hsp70 family protein [Polyangiaceae bacterium]|nr:Hsp70 family protein [Polyangiaceae bacterium]